MCCEEAGTDKACLLLVPASSQHKAAPTKAASDERYLFSARQRSPKGLGNLPQGMHTPCRSGFNREEASTRTNPSQCCSPARFSSFLQRSDRCTTRNCLPALAYRSRKVFNAAIAE